MNRKQPKLITTKIGEDTFSIPGSKHIHFSLKMPEPCNVSFIAYCLTDEIPKGKVDIKDTQKYFILDKYKDWNQIAGTENVVLNKMSGMELPAWFIIEYRPV